MDCSSLTSERIDRLAYRVGPHCAIAGNFRKSIDEGKYSVTAVLSFPSVDRSGDVVHLEPADFTEHELRGGPVDLEHARTREFGSLNIAKSVDPDGNYSVEFRVLTLDDGKTKIKLPVGTSYFDRNSRKSMQVFSMIEKGMLPAVSLEFRATHGNKLGYSAMENRPAYEFINPQVVKYTHCAEPVCPAALLTVGKAVPVSPSLDLLIPVLQTGKLGSESLDLKLLGVLRKSVAQYTPRRILVAGGFVEKAMDDPNAPAQTLYDGALDDEDMASVDGTPPGPPTAAAAYELSQDLTDAIDRAEEKLKASEHIAGKKQILKRLEKIRGEIETLIGIGDQVTSDVGGDNEGEMTEDDETPEVEEDATDKDEDGVMKAFSTPKRLWVRKSLLAARAKRFSKAEVQDAPRQVNPAPADADETLEQAIARIERDDPDGFKRIQGATHKHNRVSAWAD